MTEGMVKDPLLESKQTSKYLRFFRIAWLFEVFTVVIVSVIHIVVLQEAWSWRILAGALSIAAINMLAYSVNDYFDREVDKKHPSGSKRNPLASGEMTLGEARLLMLGVALAALVLSALVSRWAVLTNCLYMIIGVIYVAEPIRLKRRFLLDVGSHVFTVMSYSYAFTVIYFFECTGLDWFLYLNMIFTSLIVQLSQEYFDFEHDREFEHNTAIVIGKKATRGVIVAANGLYFLNTLIGYLTGNLPLVIFGYAMIMGVRLMSIFNSDHHQKVLDLFRLLLLLFTVFLIVRRIWLG